ncbi:MAG: FRG domain-containing protein [Jatrophihabitantaceae bacterium]
MGTSIDVVVSDWHELDDVLNDEIRPATAGRHHSHLAYRGVSSAAWPLQSSLKRLGGPYVALERHLIRNFRKYAYPRVAADTSEWELLTIAQHFGLPTRLLDWTFSPLVALHFATWDVSVAHENAAVWMIDYPALHSRLPNPLQDALNESGGNSFSTVALARHVPTLVDFAAATGDEAMLLFEPPSMDERVVNQYAALTAASSAGADIEHLLVDVAHPLARRVVIPAALKPSIRDRLDQFNVTERVLFPGLDGLSAWLKRYYSPPAGASRKRGTPPIVEKHP